MKADIIKKEPEKYRGQITSTGKAQNIFTTTISGLSDIEKKMRLIFGYQEENTSAKGFVFSTEVIIENKLDDILSMLDDKIKDILEVGKDIKYIEENWK